jgi:GGDEF domain-containing protein
MDAVSERFSRRASEHPGFLVLVDVSQRRLVHHVLGAAACDEVERATQDRIVSTMPTGSITCRLGLYEYGLLACCESVAEAARIADSLVRAVETPLMVPAITRAGGAPAMVPVTPRVQLGVSDSSEPGFADVNACMLAADRDLMEREDVGGASTDTRIRQIAVEAGLVDDV